MDGRPGIYSLTAHARNHGNYEVVSFDSYSDAIGDEPVQLEVVVKASGDVWANVNRAGQEIALSDSS